MKYILLFTLSMACLCAHSQTIKSTPSFGDGEKLSFIASYNMKGLMTELAGINMEVIDIPGKKKPIFKLKFTANTLTSWDDYVKVRHSYQTYVEASSIKPLVMAQDSDIKGQTTKATYKFKHNTGLAEMEITNNTDPTIIKPINIQNNTFDIVSMMYYARQIDYKAMKLGNKVPVSVLILERLINADLKFLNKEMLDVKGLGKVDCYKVAIILEHKFVVEPNVSYIWFTADENQLPVQISTIFKEGKALVKLDKFEGLKN